MSLSEIWAAGQLVQFVQHFRNQLLTLLFVLYLRCKFSAKGYELLNDLQIAFVVFSHLRK